MENKLVNMNFEQNGENQEDTIKVSVEGYSKMPFWKHVYSSGRRLCSNWSKAFDEES